MPPSILIAIGGGGATHGTDPALDRFCLKHTRLRPRVGYVGTASNDDPDKYQRFCEAFGPYAATIEPLRSNAAAPEVAIWTQGIDLIYIGGGDPTLLVDRWRDSDIAGTLAAASRLGVVLAGVSAGAMCWFERFLWRSGQNGLQKAEGLGLVPGSVTPHSLAEPDRRTRMQEMIAGNELPQGFAIDDGAALVLQDGSPSEVFPAQGPPFVRRIHRANRCLAVETILTL